MNRRKFLLATGVSLAALGVATYCWTQFSRASEKLTIDSAISLLDSVDPASLTASGSWSLIHIFDHCAKSIDYSMVGFPEHKSDGFKATLGVSAFAIFKAAGAMEHDLSEEIPAATYPVQSPSVNKAIENLILAFRQFKSFSGELKPHFAYGELNKSDYEVAHVMHLLDHWSEISSK